MATPKLILRIEVTNGVYDGVLLDFSSLPVTIGRSTENHIAIPFDTAASRAHAKIVKGDEKNPYLIIDLNSTNGTFVNGVAIKEQSEVRTGDEVKIGDTQIKLSFH